MVYFFHILICISILMIGSDFAATDGHHVEKLILPGNRLMHFLPYIGVGVYIFTIFLTRIIKNRMYRLLTFCIGMYVIGTIYYSPMWILDKYSYKIKIEKFYPQKFVKKFEKHFNTKIAQTSYSGKGKYFLVPVCDYNKSMESYLRESEGTK